MNIPGRFLAGDNRPPRYFRNVPWTAICLLFLALACMGVCAAIIAISRGQEVSSWKVQPTVLLAVFSSISNFALDTALSTGIAITWWRSCRRVTTLGRLHYIAERGTGRSFFPALVAGFDSRMVALLVALVAAANFGNNPLLQRAKQPQGDLALR